MTRGIFIVLLLIAIIGGSLLYYMQRGSSFFLKPPVDQKIAYISDADGNPDIWVMGTDGSGKMNITNDSADDQMPIWALDGKEIFAISDKVGETYQIFVSSWNGKYKTRKTISAGSKDSLVWRNDGEEIAFVANGKVYTMGRHGGQEEQFLPSHDSTDLADMSGVSSPFGYAAWSADNKQIFYIRQAEAGSQLSVGDASGEDARPLQIITARNIDAVWSPTGKKIAISYLDSSGRNGIVIFDYDTLDVRQLISTNGDTFGFAKPVWTLDSNMILFEQWTVADGMYDKCVGIYRIDASGGKPVLFVKGNARQPRISPDGTTVVYTLPYEENKRNIWSRNIDGMTDPVNLTNDTGDNFDPVWSPALAKK
ncbi:MAG: TolB family protein [Armatimonadota bacterium]